MTPSPKALEQLNKFMREADRDFAFLVFVTRPVARETLGGARFGPASDSIMRIAYGADTTEALVFPADPAELWGCEIIFDKLPEHRKTNAAANALQAARDKIAAHLPPALDSSLASPEGKIDTAPARLHLSRIRKAMRAIRRWLHSDTT